MLISDECGFSQAVFSVPFPGLKVSSTSGSFSFVSLLVLIREI